VRIRRREFITIVGGVAATWPLAARAQPVAMPVIGFLSSLSSNVLARQSDGFIQGLHEAGYIESQNIAVEYRYAEGHYDRLPGLAADLVERRVAVIMAGGPPAARAAKAATGTIPFVFTSGDDPVQIGLVPNLNRPGGNITVVHVFFSALSAKKLNLLHDLLPQVTAVAAILNPAIKCQGSGRGLAVHSPSRDPGGCRESRVCESSG
jgi:putative ABC transport system substrate-binding protein